MSLPVHLETLKAEALQTTCEGWALRKRWKLARSGAELVGPCPVCGGTDRFGINTREDLFKCRRCEIKGHGSIDLVMEVEDVNFRQACEIITGRRAEDPIDEKRAAEFRAQAERDAKKRDQEAARRRQQAIARAREVLTDAVPLIAGCEEVVGYLGKRGITLPPELRSEIRIGQVDARPYMEPANGGWVQLYVGPAMVAAIRQSDGHITAVHQTWIDPVTLGKLSLPPDEKGGERPAKKVLGSKKGGAIRLYTPEKPRRLVMGEGIETTLTALAHNFEPDTAYWTSVDLGNFAGRAKRNVDGTTVFDEPDPAETEAFMPPDWVQELVFLTDDDDQRNHTEAKVVRGLKRALAWRAARQQQNPALADIECSYMPPLGEGRDLNDLVRVG